MRLRLTVKLSAAYNDEKPWVGRLRSWAFSVGHGPRPVRVERNDYAPLGGRIEGSADTDSAE